MLRTDLLILVATWLLGPAAAMENEPGNTRPVTRPVQAPRQGFGLFSALDRLDLSQISPYSATAIQNVAGRRPANRPKYDPITGRRQGMVTNLGMFVSDPSLEAEALPGVWKVIEEGEEVEPEPYYVDDELILPPTIEEMAAARRARANMQTAAAAAASPDAAYIQMEIARGGLSQDGLDNNAGPLQSRRGQNYREPIANAQGENRDTMSNGGASNDSFETARGPTEEEQRNMDAEIADVIRPPGQGIGTGADVDRNAAFGSAVEGDMESNMGATGPDRDPNFQDLLASLEEPVFDIGQNELALQQLNRAKDPLEVSKRLPEPQPLLQAEPQPRPQSRPQSGAANRRETNQRGVRGFLRNFPGRARDYFRSALDKIMPGQPHPTTLNNPTATANMANSLYSLRRLNPGLSSSPYNVPVLEFGQSIPDDGAPRNRLPSAYYY
ncbi:hypothetical protein DRE_01225 [Drechslerella stenobrocha 248]|uniref:Uncharacterized protein n=1 Tax=Drechslerella stenobrocha 248 TaxID=1043628 RepID=W7HMR5_9PEZI|nr:hypothetical protein DRE_01225 [Drechslerella stenobrocha 248]